MDEVPLFRANKRRRFARHKDAESTAPSQSEEVPVIQDDAVTIAKDETNVSNLVKLRKQSRPKSSGVLFSQRRHTEEADSDANRQLALTKVDPDEERLRTIANRFVGSTGQVVDVDKHMMAYIDSEMAKRQPTVDSSSDPVDPSNHNQLVTRHHQQQHHDTSKSAAAQAKTPSTYPSQAQLAEFDLGPDSYQKNLARTEAAIARAQSGLPPTTTEEDPKPRRPPRKPRLGPDGKPWRTRPRKRRNSEDIARDAMVEQMLHEHKMDITYKDDPAITATAAAAATTAAEPGQRTEHNNNNDDDGNDNEDADEKLAAQFKQEFMDAMAERHQRHQVKAATAAKAKGMGPEQSGPKLGGGRSARAKMAQMHQQQQLQQQQQQQQGGQGQQQKSGGGGGGVGLGQK